MIGFLLRNGPSLAFVLLTVGPVLAVLLSIPEIHQ